jgi:enterochelin esterase family protein
MLVVMAYGYARRAGQPVPVPSGRGFGSPAARKAMQDMMSAFEADVTDALIPFIDRTFRTIADRDHRAMAGLSMGGMQAFQIALNHLDLFSHLAGFSGAAGTLTLGRDLDPKTDYNGVFADPAAFAKKMHVLWLGVGTAEPEGMRAGIRKLHASLTEAGIAHVYQESPGTDHEWQTWRRNLNDFAARLFR